VKPEDSRSESRLDDLSGGSQAGVEEQSRNLLVRLAGTLALSRWYVKILLVSAALAIPLVVSWRWG
jgi:hypothetical protein